MPKLAAMCRLPTLEGHAVIAAIAVLACNALPAQTIDTNRPGFAYTTGIVPQGNWQLETGFTTARPGGSGARTTSLPLAEMRFGVADNVEIFASSLNWSRSETPNRDSSGLVDALIGTKIALESSERLRSALLFQVSVPIGDSDFSSDSWDPSAAYVWAYDGRMSVVGTARVSYVNDTFQLDNSFQLPFALNDRQSAFVEWEANLPEGGRDAHWLNGGVLWLLDNRRLIDFEVGAGLNDAAGDYRLSAGFSILF